jgi:putative phosphoribosyl transferase
MNGFRNRRDAGRRLAAALRAHETEQPIVLALPRGGVPVGYEVARALHAPLDVWIVRKIGVPWHPELGVGAVAEGGHVLLNQDILAHVGLSGDVLTKAIESKQREVDERVRRIRGGHPQPVLRGRTVIVVDDGIATGGTVRAVIQSIRAHGPKAIVLAVPVAARQTVRAIAPEVDRMVCLKAPADLHAIGLWYAEFHQVPDEDVTRLLDRARLEHAAGAGG